MACDCAPPAQVRTSKQEAEEVLEATVKSADIMEERKTRQLERQVKQMS